jgi:apolipoprotein N-acyltransferase
MINMNRRTGFAFSMILIGLWWGQTAISQSGIVSLLMGILAVTLTCFGGGILCGIFHPEGLC